MLSRNYNRGTLCTVTFSKVSPGDKLHTVIARSLSSLYAQEINMYNSCLVK